MYKFAADLLSSRDVADSTLMVQYSSSFEQATVEHWRALILTVYISVNHATLFKFSFKAAITKIMLLMMNTHFGEWTQLKGTHLVIFLSAIVNVVSQSSQIHCRFASEMEIPPLSRLASGVGPFCIAPFASTEERSNGSHCARSRQGAAASAVPTPPGHLLLSGVLELKPITSLHF